MKDKKDDYEEEEEKGRESDSKSVKKHTIQKSETEFERASVCTCFYVLAGTDCPHKDSFVLRHSFVLMGTFGCFFFLFVFNKNWKFYLKKKKT